MESYSVLLKKSVEKDLRKIPKEQLPNIFEHIEKPVDFLQVQREMIAVVVSAKNSCHY